MSVIAHNGKVVVSGGKTLNFDNLIALANNTTGETDTTLTDAVQSLIDGFGGGGVIPAPYGYRTVVNGFDFTPAQDSNPDIVLEHGLGCLPAYILVAVKDVQSVMNNGLGTFIAGVYYSGSQYAEYMNQQWNVPTTAVDPPYARTDCIGGYYKRYYETNIIRTDESTGASTKHSYIKDVTNSTFSLSYQTEYAWRADVPLSIFCVGFIKEE